MPLIRLEVYGRRQEWDEDGREWGAVAIGLGHELDNKLIILGFLSLIRHVLLFLIKPDMTLMLDELGRE